MENKQKQCLACHKIHEGQYETLCNSCWVNWSTQLRTFDKFLSTHTKNVVDKQNPLSKYDRLFRIMEQTFNKMYDLETKEINYEEFEKVVYKKWKREN